jgi:AcrR family transcriptional regulator
MAEQEIAPRGRHAPPLEVRQDRQRARLFAAASAVFARAGFADATAEAIAREAGMSKATFYEHFGNKEECLLALFDAAMDVVVEGIAQAAQEHGGRARRAGSAPPCARSSRSSTPSPTRRRRCWSRSSARARARPSAATPR